MLYYLLYPLRDYFFIFNVFKYITFRAAFAAITAMILSVCLGPYVIARLYRLKIGEEIRKEDCLPLYALHKNKKGTPTMGGVLIIISILLSTILWADLANKNVLLSIFVMLWLGVLGFIDDYIKVVKKKSLGLKPRVKFFWQVLLALIVGIYILMDVEIGKYITIVSIPFFKNLVVDLGIFYLFFFVLVLVGSSNAVNLTDGIDGLAIGCVVISIFAYAIISYIVGNIIFTDYLQILYVPLAGELTVLCASIIGGGMGFLWYNAYPAQVFMGDTGSLSLGGILGLIAVLVKQELILLLIGGIFVVEALSVIIQVFSFKTRGKRVFLMSPIHHHFEIKGWAEMKVTIRFWIIAIIFALLGLSSLKLR